jgi:hypothetical protein
MRAAPRAPAENANGGALSDEEGSPSWPDETAESAFLADARDRGESVTSTPAPKAEAADDADTNKPLPPLDELVKRIPAEVRETLDDLFRARFVTVRRVPKKALK